MKNDVFLIKKAGALFYKFVCYNCAKFQIDCSKTVEGDVTNLSSCISHSSNISKFEKAVILRQKSFKRQGTSSVCLHSCVQSFRLFLKKMWKKLIILFCHPVLDIT